MTATIYFIENVKVLKKHLEYSDAEGIELLVFVEWLF